MVNLFTMLNIHIFSLSLFFVCLLIAFVIDIYSSFRRHRELGKPEKAKKYILKEKKQKIYIRIICLPFLLVALIGIVEMTPPTSVSEYTLTLFYTSDIMLDALALINLRISF
ncbi:hypothetical protein C5L28_002484 [Lentilactobacillus parakefiri]|uniref:Uncharacterized protein n=1 Tax=Lentilactobacillus parakefiri TaxID=152332 RepID=A0A224VMC1_9LACO|nr:hypothetical protein B8W96_05945 [Lentilactobacillus parakefiri]TDG88071.1 hypothetical protein C5L28_002484 [Lentilactobacillus parakefiri]GAW73330.1 hypothetical protein LPKJCM_02474 [Lentilactobacillus parakefiri]